MARCTFLWRDACSRSSGFQVSPSWGDVPFRFWVCVLIPWGGWRGAVWHQLGATEKNGSLNSVFGCCVLPLFGVSGLSASERLALFGFGFVHLFCSKPGMVLFAFFWSRQAKAGWRHFLAFCVPIIGWSWEASPQELTDRWFFPSVYSMHKASQTPTAIPIRHFREQGQHF